MNRLDAIGHLERVAFEDIMVPDLGTILWCEADFQVEADEDAYAFFVRQIYTQQSCPEGTDGFSPPEPTPLHRSSWSWNCAIFSKVNRQSGSNSANWPMRQAWHIGSMSRHETGMAAGVPWHARSGPLGS